MIRFQLKCCEGHEFEAWFHDGASFEKQRAGGSVECPFCGTTDVGKALMAPSLGRNAGKKTTDEDRAREVARKILRAVNNLRDHVEDNCEYVGDQFAEEARRIQYGETDERDIYGEATSEESTELDEEGIEFFHVPWAPRRDD